MAECREMTLPHFMREFDYERDKLTELCRSKDWEGKIAFKVGRQWKIDVSAYIKLTVWRSSLRNTLEKNVISSISRRDL